MTETAVGARLLPLPARGDAEASYVGQRTSCAHRQRVPGYDAHLQPPDFFGTFSHRLPKEKSRPLGRAREGDAGTRLWLRPRRPAPPTWHDAACRQRLHEVSSPDQSGDIGLNGSAKASNHCCTNTLQEVSGDIGLTITAKESNHG